MGVACDVALLSSSGVRTWVQGSPEVQEGRREGLEESP